MDIELLLAVSRGQSPLDAYKNRIEILERQLSYERTENMLVLENIRTSTKSLKEQTIFMMMLLCIQIHRNGQLESCVRCLIGSHPILMLALLKDRATNGM
jgi:DNA polymerase III gamma/tau subunit